MGVQAVKVFSPSTIPHPWRTTFATLAISFWVTVALGVAITWPLLWLLRLFGPLQWSWTPVQA